MDIQQAIQTHGATAVYYAAVRATEGNIDALQSVDINGRGLSLAWDVMSAAHRAMSDQDITQEQIATAAKLANIKTDD